MLKTFVIFFIDGIYCCFFCFLSNHENLYVIHHDSDLFYDIYSTINEYDQRQSHCLWSFLIIFITIFKWTKKFFHNFICFIINHNFYGFTFWIHYMIFIIICGRTKLFGIVNWILHVSDFLGLFIMSFKYGLIFLQYFQTDSVLFLSSLLSYSM